MSNSPEVVNSSNDGRQSCWKGRRVSTELGSLCIAYVQFGPWKLWRREVSAIQELLKYWSEWKDSRDFQNCPLYCGCPLLRGSTVFMHTSCTHSLVPRPLPSFPLLQDYGGTLTKKMLVRLTCTVCLLQAPWIGLAWQQRASASALYSVSFERRLAWQHQPTVLACDILRLSLE